VAVDRWQFRTDGGRVLARSETSYESQSAATEGVETFKTRVSGGQTEDARKPRGEIFGISLDKVLVPVLVAVLAGLGSFLATRGAIENGVKVKAAELAFAGSPTVVEVQNRIALLASLYPNELKEWKDKAQGPDYLFPSANSARWAFLQLQMQKVACGDQVTQLWRQLFGPDRVPALDDKPDQWVTGVTVLAACPQAPASAAAPTAAP
jgi:hypothetical protein